MVFNITLYIIVYIICIIDLTYIFIYYIYDTYTDIYI